MPINPRPVIQPVVSDTPTPFSVTLATAATAEDLVTVPSQKSGRAVSLINDGPGDVALAFDATATISDLVIREGEAYDEHDLEITTNISFINVTVSATPTVRGVLWSGD